MILAVGVIVLAVLVANFWTKSAEVEVTGHRWERSIEIEAYQAVDEGDWCDRLPGEAYDTRQEQRQRGTTQGSKVDRQSTQKPLKRHKTEGLFE